MTSAARADITVQYCEDEPENDGSLASIILKAAADYSRVAFKEAVP